MGFHPAAVVQCLKVVKHLYVRAAAGRHLRSCVEPQVLKCTCVSAAISANMAIFVAKMATFWVSGSSAMLAESIHSVADIFNQVGHRLSLTPKPEAPDGKRQCLLACTCTQKTQGVAAYRR